MVEDFIGKFKFPFDGFSSPNKWVDAEGFGVAQDFDNKRASLYKIGIFDQGHEKSNPLKRLWISVTYGEKIQGGGIRLMTERKLSDPIDLDLKDEYFYNADEGKFYHRDQEINPQSILKRVKELHLLPTKKVKGFFLRSRLFFWRRFLPTFIEILDVLLISFLWLISGEKITGTLLDRLVQFLLPDRNREKRANDPIQKDVGFKESEKIEFFGNKVKRWPVVFYCALHLLVYVIFFLGSIKDPLFISRMIHSSFLLICYVIVSLTIIESIIPYVLRAIIKITPRIFRWITFKVIEI